MSKLIRIRWRDAPLPKLCASSVREAGRKNEWNAGRGLVYKHCRRAVFRHFEHVPQMVSGGKGKTRKDARGARKVLVWHVARRDG